jgi:hypothetical protein
MHGYTRDIRVSAYVKYLALIEQVGYDKIPKRTFKEK